MGQRSGSRTEADADGEILPAPLLRDEVDDLVAAWRAQRPDLDVEPMQVLSRISRLARHLDIARRGAFAEHELESWEFDVLSALRRQGPPFQLTPGALLRATLVTSGTMTNRIDRLAAADLVRREPDPSDKRGVLVTLTDQGQARVDAALAGLLRRERVLLADLDAGERQHLADLMRILLAPFDDVFRSSPLGSLPLRAPPQACLRARPQARRRAPTHLPISLHRRRHPSSLLRPGGAGGPLARLGFQVGGYGQPAFFKVCSLGLGGLQLGAEFRELFVVGGVGG
jgi:DNA-binding MarR family transcriptional regulator